MPKRERVNINGNICDSQEAQISVFDRGFLYGDSVYEVTYSKGGKLIFLEEHMNRMENSASLLNIPLTFSKEKLMDEMKKTLKDSQIDRAYVRIILTRGEGPISLMPPKKIQNNYVIIVKELPENPTWWYKEGFKLAISSTVRNNPKSIDPNAKSGNYLNNVMAAMEAQEKGFDDAIMENKDGLLTEGTTFNIWMVKENKVMTPPIKAGLLKGITRTKILETIKIPGIEFIEKDIQRSDIYQADEVFITSSTKEVLPVTKVDQTVYTSNGPGPITQKIMSGYKELIDQHTK